jgi:hypothetical protein
MKTIPSLPFLFLFLSTFAEGQAGVTLLVKTDMTCNWKLDERSMGLLMADDPKVVLVAPGEHFIEAAATDGAATSRTRVEVDKVEKTVDIQLKSENLKSQEELKSKMQQAETSKGPVRVDSAQDPTWTDPATGLMWTGKDNGSDVDWPEAEAYCSKSQQAGYSDWRLPTMDELQGIYDPSVSAPQEFGDGLTADVHVKGHLKVTGWTWTGRQRENPGKPYEEAWFFEFGSAPLSLDVGKPRKVFLHFRWDMRALCVRGSEKDVVDR